MNAISRLSFSNDNADSARTAGESAALTLGLGPNQLDWLRRNISPFKEAEQQRRLMREDVVRAARIAGLI
jgi:hypothetical protein